jgi:hypothetical protein
MGYSNYSEIESAIRKFEPFTGNSCRGVLDGTEYRVYSYSTQILHVNFPTGGIALNVRKYSNTTSRLQNIIRRALSDFTISEVN